MFQPHSDCTASELGFPNSALLITPTFPNKIKFFGPIWQSIIASITTTATQNTIDLDTADGKADRALVQSVRGSAEHLVRHKQATTTSTVLPYRKPSISLGY
jgi:hypothetical protein